MKTFRNLLPVFIVVFLVVIFYSCSNNSYQANSITTASKFPDVIEKANKDKRYFIMRSGLNIYAITSVDLDRAKQLMTVTLDKVDSSHLVYLKNPEIRRSKSRAGETPAAPEIH